MLLAGIRLDLAVSGERFSGKHRDYLPLEPNPPEPLPLWELPPRPREAPRLDMMLSNEARNGRCNCVLLDTSRAEIS